MAGEIFVPSLGKAQEAGKVKLAVEETEQQRLAQLAEVAHRGKGQQELNPRVDSDGNEEMSAFNTLLAELHQERSKLNALAFTDMLTNVANRRLFIEHAESALRTTKRRGSVMALAYIDLDDFKTVNDTHGADAGDALLIAVAKRLQQAVREVDTVARLGGDEYTIILHDVGSRAYVERLVSRIFASLAEPVSLPDGSVWNLSCSLGVVLSDGIEDLKSLMARADKAMRSVKLGGKNQYLVKDLFED